MQNNLHMDEDMKQFIQLHLESFQINPVVQILQVPLPLLHVQPWLGSLLIILNSTNYREISLSFQLLFDNLRIDFSFIIYLDIMQYHFIKQKKLVIIQLCNQLVLQNIESFILQLLALQQSVLRKSDQTMFKNHNYNQQLIWLHKLFDLFEK
ncbi:unnamed protein product [Paramecium sonneborni]|uniref:Uncharacterized protein n=1 Tax=Paramecium sonneborni TaxID=65129 RepID=A0A8S1RUI1_9CILI|nr:unnamed protein product [Paramecium sonneborni]